MKSKFIIMLTFAALQLVGCAQNIQNLDEQIGAAVMAVPEELRAQSTVLGYDAKGQLVTLREGSNNTICIADDPSQDGFNVACYHKDLEAFMARGRELKAQGKTRGEIFEMREEEAKSGKLKMPEQATTLHLLEGPMGNYDHSKGVVNNAQYRYVVYIPWATAESSGLPTKPIVPGGPWIMDPGTHRAHIMISTPPSGN